MKKMPPRILVLGSSGMLGRVVFAYLKKSFPQTTWGTTRNHDNSFFYFDVQTAKEDLDNIIKKIKNIDYVINCIGALRKSSEQELQRVNSEFPYVLATFAETYTFKILHVSTDAVFSATSENVFENDPTAPEDEYGKSKLAGECDTKNVLSIRTSLIGFDPKEQKGLFEWVRKSAEKSLSGYTNQIWSGCTVLQFAQLCNQLIEKNSFDSLREKSAVFHFAPIQPLSKYSLLRTFVHLATIRTQITKGKGETLTRTLVTKFPNELCLDQYKKTAQEAIEELLAFEKKI